MLPDHLLHIYQFISCVLGQTHLRLSNVTFITGPTGPWENLAGNKSSKFSTLTLGMYSSHYASFLLQTHLKINATPPPFGEKHLSFLFLLSIFFLLYLEILTFYFKPPPHHKCSLPSTLLLSLYISMHLTHPIKRTSQSFLHITSANTSSVTKLYAF